MVIIGREELRAGLGSDRRGRYASQFDFYKLATAIEVRTNVGGMAKSGQSIVGQTTERSTLIAVLES